MSDPVREFIVRTLSAAGGVVEEGPRGIEALLPPEAARRMGVPEELDVRLSSSTDAVSEGAPAGRVDGRIGSPFLERLVSARLGDPRIAAVAFPSGLPMPPPEGPPVLLNAVRAGSPEKSRTPCRFLSLELRVTLHGEELRNLLVPLTLRLEDGARTEPFRVSGAYPVTTRVLDERERGAASAALRSWLLREGAAAHASALESLRRRARRDLASMAEYYEALDSEMEKAIGRARSEEERARRRAKWEALPTDLENRRDQLRVRVLPRLGARVVAATLIESDVERHQLPVRRRRRKGTVTLCSRLADGVLEGPACAACGVATLRLYLCDDRLHPLCDACGREGRLDPSRCPACAGEEPDPPVIVVEDPTAGLRVGGGRGSRISPAGMPE